jgi:hypothetical protein
MSDRAEADETIAHVARQIDSGDNRDRALAILSLAHLSLEDV